MCFYKKSMLFCKQALSQAPQFPQGLLFSGGGFGLSMEILLTALIRPHQWEIYRKYTKYIEIQLFRFQGKQYVKSRSFIAFVGQRTPPETLRTICEPPGPSFGFARFSYIFSNCVFLQNRSYFECFRDNSTTKMQPRGVRSYHGFIKKVDFVLFFTLVFSLFGSTPNFRFLYV